VPVLAERPNVERPDFETRVVGAIVRGLSLFFPGHLNTTALLVIALVVVLAVIVNRMS
jgi:hypothetical protein